MLNGGEAVRLGASQVRWVLADADAGAGVGAGVGRVSLPVYLNGDRSDVLFTAELPFDSAAGALVATRAVCLTAGG